MKSVKQQLVKPNSMFMLTFDVPAQVHVNLLGHVWEQVRGEVWLKVYRQLRAEVYDTN